MDIKQLIPFGDVLIVEPIAEETKTAGGLVIPDSAKDKPNQGRVIAKGDGKQMHDGKQRRIPLDIGDRILFAKYGGSEFKVNEVTYVLVSLDDVLCKII